MKLVGLSLSMCIRDIINRVHNKDEVRYIVANTSFRNETEFQEVLDFYKKAYWGESPGVAEAIAREFFEKGMIRQPKLHGHEHPSKNRYIIGIWMLSEGG